MNYINGDALKNDFTVGNIIIRFLGPNNVGLTNKILSVRQLEAEMRKCNFLSDLHFAS